MFCQVLSALVSLVCAREQPLDLSGIDSVKSSAGIYWNDRYIPIAAAMLNLILSILFVQKYQIAGVLIGTIVSKITLNFWIQPLLVYKLLFKRRLLDYFVMIIKYLCAFFGIEALSYSALKMINLQMNFIILILEGILINSSKYYFMDIVWKNS